MTEKRLPSFNDFSPVLLKQDLRVCLQVVVDAAGDDGAAIAQWAKLYFDGVENKRSSTNVPATLRSTGLIRLGRPFVLSDAGQSVLSAADSKAAALEFCRHIIQNKNGNLLLAALLVLRKRGEKITKISLQNELVRHGVVGLSTNTTDHTTLRNWMILAGIIDVSGAENEDVVREVMGLTVAEADEFSSLPLAQQIFLQLVRREHLTSDGPFPVPALLAECLANYPDLFDSARFADKVRKPLEVLGWIESAGLASGRNGGKSGVVRGSQKLREIPIDRFVPDFEASVPAELRAKLQTPLEEIRADLFSDDTYKGGVALELLALRMVLDLGLDPRHFRLRSAASAHAEVDLIAEGSHLMFSRWTVQCKRNNSGAKVSLSDVAKEMGIAIFAKAHVVVMVTTADFTADARNYASEVSLSQPVQFLFVPGAVVKEYLTLGREVLLSHARNNAKDVMLHKRRQQLPSGQD